ncbi:MAG: hypothetical protein WCI95_01290 [bacterium]
MKKIFAALAIGLMLMGAAPTAKAADAGAATVLSAILPGCGEWYNNGWKGSFPFVECIGGYICFCITLSSMMDAANGSADEALRIDFWSSPSK